MDNRRDTQSTTDSHDLMELDSQNDSTDLLNMTTQTEASPGPALVSNSSQDSDFIGQMPAGASLRQGGDMVTWPSVREAEALADQMTRELLDNSDTTVRRSSNGADLGDLEQQTGAPAEKEEEDKENILAEPVVKREQAEERVETVEQEHQQEQHELDQSRPADDSRIRQDDVSVNEPLHQTFKTAFNASQNDETDHHHYQEFDEDHKQDNDNDNNNTKPDIMEFTKNYSDDLLMGAGGQQQRATNNNDSADLADFELPPYNGSSSSGSEQAPASSSQQQHSPAKQRKTSNTATQASSTSTSSGSDLTAVKNILISSYSKGAHVFHWKKPIESGIIFAIGLALIAALTFFSIISVVAYSALGVVLASALIRIYKTSMKALNRSTETPVDHIWETVLGLNVSMSPERMHQLIDSSHENLNASLVYFKQVLLVEDKVATLRFFLFLYALTYIGAWFNGLTLITIVYVSVFSVPIIYEKNKTNIDQYLNLATDQISSVVSLVTGRVTALIGQSSSAKKQN